MINSIIDIYDSFVTIFYSLINIFDFLIFEVFFFPLNIIIGFFENISIYQNLPGFIRVFFIFLPLFVGNIMLYLIIYWVCEDLLKRIKK